MKLQYYFTLLVLATVITLIGVSEWNQSKKSEDEKRNAFFTSLDSQTLSLEQAIKNRIENLRYQLAQAASRHSDSSSSLSADSEFSAIAWLQKNPEGSAAKYKAVWAEANTQTFDPTWLKGLNFSQIKDGETLFVRRTDRSGNAFFALVMTALNQSSHTATELPEQAQEEENERVYLFAAIASSTLAAWVDDWVGSSRAAFIFDEHGNVISHSQRQYTGTNLSTDKFVSSSLRSGKAKLTSEFADLENEKRVGASLRVGQTNLRAAVTVPKAAMLKPTETNRNSQRGILLSVGLILVGLTYFVSGRLASRLPKENLVLQNPQSSTSVVMEPAIAVPVIEPEPELTFEDVEQKTRLNLEEILARSKQIRQRLQIDFDETVESEQKAFFEDLAANESADTTLATSKLNESELNLPKVKVRRPKVSL